MKNPIFRTVWAILLSLLVFEQTWAANETEFTLHKQMTSVIPVFMSGHENDPNWIKGYQLTGDIFFDGTNIGTFSGEVMLFDPPLTFEEQYGQALMTIENSLPEIGEYTVTAYSILLASSTFATTGDFVAAWSGSVSNGTGALENMYGLSAGNSIGSIFTASGGRITEVLNLRSGF